MIEEAYVNFETAKLLKEKGFDEICYLGYNKNGEYFPTNNRTNSQITQPDFCFICCPTQQMAMRWLREVHNIGIFPSTYTHIKDIKTTHSYGTAIVNLKTYELMTDDYLSNDTYEGAVEEAIKYCLENLI